MMQPSDIVFGLTGDITYNSRGLKQLGLLLELGYQVDVLTFTPLQRNLPSEDHIRFHRLSLPIGHGPRYFARVHKLLRQRAIQIPATLYHASDLYTLPALSSAARAHGGLLAYDARERYPYVAATAGRPWVRLFWSCLEMAYIRRPNAIFTVSPSIAAHIAASYDISPPKVLYNVPSFHAVAPSDRLRTWAKLPADTAIILHQGQMRDDRGCEYLVKAMQRVSGAALIFLGDGPLKPALVQLTQTLKLSDKVRFHPPVPPDQLLPLTAGATLGVTLLVDTCLNHRLALPNKLFEYLMAGLPVLGSNLPEIRSVIEAKNVGLLVDPADPAALADTLQRMVDDREARKQWSINTKTVFETFSWEQASQVFKQTYRTLLSPQKDS